MEWGVSVLYPRMRRAWKIQDTDIQFFIFTRMNATTTLVEADQCGAHPAKYQSDRGPTQYQ